MKKSDLEPDSDSSVSNGYTRDAIRINTWLKQQYTVIISWYYSGPLSTHFYGAEFMRDKQ